jgi:hypothetical protein
MSLIYLLLQLLLHLLLLLYLKLLLMPHVLYLFPCHSCWLTGKDLHRRTRLVVRLLG